MTNAESDYIRGKAKNDVVDSNLLQTELEKNTEKKKKKIQREDNQEGKGNNFISKVFFFINKKQICRKLKLTFN